MTVKTSINAFGRFNIYIDGLLHLHIKSPFDIKSVYGFITREKEYTIEISTPTGRVSLEYDRRDLWETILKSLKILINEDYKSQEFGISEEVTL